MKSGKRLQVYLAHSGVASRRKSERYIDEGRVKVNGEVVTEQGVKVGPEDRVCFDGKVVRPEHTHRYIALNKPPKYICSNYDPQERALAVDLLRPHFEERLYNVGRLDYMSEGLIFFTNDGEFAEKVGHPSSGIEKEYLVELFDSVHGKPVTEEKVREALEKAKEGIDIEDVRYTVYSFQLVRSDRRKGQASMSYRRRGQASVNRNSGEGGIGVPARIRRQASLDLTLGALVTLVEGKNREIRKLFSHFDLSIRRLIRIRIGEVELGSLPVGKFRELSETEVNRFLSSGRAATQSAQSTQSTQTNASNDADFLETDTPGNRPGNTKDRRRTT